MQHTPADAALTATPDSLMVPPPPWTPEEEAELQQIVGFLGSEAERQVIPTRRTRVATKIVAAKALKHLKRNAFPGLRSLARILQCPPSTLSKAINTFPRLKERCHPSNPPSRQTGIGYDDLVTASDMMNQLLQDATPAERAKINSLPEDQQRRLAEASYPEPERRFRGRS